MLNEFERYTRVSMKCFIKITSTHVIGIFAKVASKIIKVLARHLIFAPTVKDFVTALDAFAEIISSISKVCSCTLEEI